MRVKVKLYGGLKLPFKDHKNEEGIYVDLKDNYSLEELINLLSLSGKTLIIVVNGIVCNDLQKKLEDEDTVSIFPPIAGG